MEHFDMENADLLDYEDEEQVDAGEGVNGAGTNGTGPNPAPGGIGVQLPATFRDPANLVGAPGPGPGTHWICGGGGGGIHGGGSVPADDRARGGGPGGPYAGGGDGGYATAPTYPPMATVNGTDAWSNTGGGGGGGNGNAGGTMVGVGGNGGSGIFIIAYPT